MVDLNILRVGAYAQFAANQVATKGVTSYTQSQTRQVQPQQTNAQAVEPISSAPATQALDGRIGRINAQIEQMGDALKTLDKASEAASTVTALLENFRDQLSSSTADPLQTTKTVTREVSVSPVAETRTREEERTVNASVQGTSNLSASATAGSLNSGSGFGLSITIGSQQSTITASADETVDDFVSRLNETDGISVTLDDDGRLNITADDNQTLEIRETTSGSLSALGISTNATETQAVERQETVNASTTGIRDLTQWQAELDFASLQADSGVRITVGDGPEQSVTRSDAVSVGDFVNKINDLDGITATLDDQGRVNIEAQNGQSLDIKSVNDEAFSVLGLSANGTETVAVQQTVTDNAVVEGSVNVRDLALVHNLDGGQIGRTFEVKLGSASEATEIQVTDATDPQDLLDDLNAIANVSASYNAQGGLRIEATDGSSLTVTDTYGKLVDDFGITENTTEIVTTTDTTNQFNTSTTGTLDLGSSDLRNLTGVNEGDSFKVQVGEREAVTIDIARNDADELVDQLNQIENLVASITANGELSLSTDNGLSFSLENVSGTAVQGLGITDNIVDRNVTQAQISGSVDLGTGKLQDLAGVEHNDEFTVSVGGNDTTLRIASDDKFDDLVDDLSAIEGVTASVNDSGQLQISSTDGERIELRNTEGSPLAGLGIALNDSEDIAVAGYTQNAIQTGTVSFDDRDKLKDISSNFDSGSIRITVGELDDGEMVYEETTLSFSGNDRIEDVVAAIDGLGGIRADLNDAGQIEITGNNSSVTFTLDSVSAYTVGPLGLTEDQTATSTYVPPTTVQEAYASADATDGADIRTVRVDSATANATHSQATVNETRGIVDLDATQVTVSENQDVGFTQAQAQQVTETITETVLVDQPSTFETVEVALSAQELQEQRELAEREEGERLAALWESTASQIQSTVGLALASGSTLIAGGSNTVAQVDGGTREARAGDLSIDGLNLSDLQSVLKSGDVSQALDLVSSALSSAYSAENKVNFATAQVNFNQGLADIKLDGLREDRADIFSVANASSTASDTASQLGALQLSLADNRSAQLRSFF